MMQGGTLAKTHVGGGTPTGAISPHLFSALLMLLVSCAELT